MVIATGFLIAYDYGYLYNSLPLVYDASDKIILTIDKERKTLSGGQFEVEDHFFTWIKKFDTANKIQWLERTFFQKDLSPLEIIMNMRNAMMAAMSPADWYVQLDCDEYFLDFERFATFLQSLQENTNRLVIQCKWKTLFKKLDRGFLTIGGKAETVPVVTNQPQNTSERMHRDAQVIESPFFILHQSWARTTPEIRQKIKNWSHSRDFDTKKFFSVWSDVNKSNYRSLRHFHPLHPPIWPFLEWVDVDTIDDLIGFYRANPPKEDGTPTLPLAKRIQARLRSIFN